MQVSGAAAKQAAVAGNYFSNMCLAGEQSPYLKDIEQVGVAQQQQQPSQLIATSAQQCRGRLRSMCRAAPNVAAAESTNENFSFNPSHHVLTSCAP